LAPKILAGNSNQDINSLPTKFVLAFSLKTGKAWMRCAPAAMPPTSLL
jgi:hypothetical protein